MLPAAPYFGWVIYVVLASMHGAVGQEKQKLLGVSAGSYMAAFSNRMTDKMEHGGRYDDSTY